MKERPHQVITLLKLSVEEDSIEDSRAEAEAMHKYNVWFRGVAYSFSVDLGAIGRDYYLRFELAWHGVGGRRSKDSVEVVVLDYIRSFSCSRTMTDSAKNISKCDVLFPLTGYKSIRLKNDPA